MYDPISVRNFMDLLICKRYVLSEIACSEELSVRQRKQILQRGLESTRTSMVEMYLNGISWKQYNMFTYVKSLPTLLQLYNHPSYHVWIQLDNFKTLFLLLSFFYKFYNVYCLLNPFHLGYAVIQEGNSGNTYLWSRLQYK